MAAQSGCRDICGWSLPLLHSTDHNTLVVTHMSRPARSTRANVSYKDGRYPHDRALPSRQPAPSQPPPHPPQSQSQSWLLSMPEELLQHIIVAVALFVVLIDAVALLTVATVRVGVAVTVVP